MIPWLKKPRDPRHVLGIKGEIAAVRHMRKQGFRILKRNYCSKHGEIDIIAERNGSVHFLEVKSRISDTHGAPEESVTEAKQRRIRQAAHAYLSEFRSAPNSISFDTVAVVFTDQDKVADVRWNSSMF